jgi:hypothetical protein
MLRILLATGQQKLNEIIEHIRCGLLTEADKNCLEKRNVEGLYLSDVAVEISILLMCTEDNSVQRVKDNVKGIMYGV